ncbi:iron-containing alcohol dehydrogenase [candidate division NPL-UPA2 bacterium Unc8]|uniref:Iron-containing alcohol dehydrogenase n=1 Tax=candidate division NPL-UPA2 bacterium Unc8 TaxID=1980939 RepID=A0A399FXQ9_UNCN2|nr:MAG: iron-containing alcohol dehydrogenase [candidate division NPL-UPA2 bacterium Unc8]
MGYDRSLSFIFRCPTKIVFGEGVAGDVGNEVDELGGKRAMIITDKHLVETDLYRQVEKALGRRYVGTFSAVEPDTGVHIVNEGTDTARKLNVDCLVSIGGGSVIDTAKGIAIPLKEGGRLEDYDGFQLLTEPAVPHIAIPTTAGTGSEVTFAAIIKDHQEKRKLVFANTYIIPNVALLDPLMTVGMPPHLTASTAMDAMSHAVESMHTSERIPISDAFALHAIHLIVNYLPGVMEDGNDLLARGQMLIAACIAGAAMSNTHVGLVHALAHSVGGRFGVPHGIANSILLPHGILYNLDACPEIYAAIARALGVDIRGMSDEDAGKKAADAIWELTKKAGLPQKLSEVGVPENGLEEIADLAISDGAIVYNPKPMDPEENLKVLKQAW